MDKNDTLEMKKKHTYTLFFNIAVMISSFTIALVALPQEMFFVVAVVILFALRDIEKDITKTNSNRFTFRTSSK
ncbi:MAG: hypothetical protein WCX28_02235 [Bacteriovoracaceae bacterium]|nr:hypothetical protein [Bacteroidota bacterium]